MCLQKKSMKTTDSQEAPVELKHNDEFKEHIFSADCWCGPTVEYVEAK